MKTLTTKEVAALTKTSQQLARKWAKENQVNFVGSDKAKIYLWTEADLERFKSRNKQRGNFSKSKKNKESKT